jgi:transcriptional regulator with XRE-family HTH domain
MPSSFNQFRRRALARPDVREAYDELEEEFVYLDELLKARAAAGLTQAELAERVGTSQSAIARLESVGSRHSPSIATLQRYAKALGCRLEIRFVQASNRRQRPGSKKRAGAPEAR